MNGRPKEEAAHITANELLSNAKLAVNDEYSEDSILVAAHMQVAMLDLLKSTLIEEFRALRKEVISLEARLVGDLGGVVRTDRERKLIYQALMDDYMPRFSALGSIAMIAAGELDIDAAPRRFMKIAGLE
jgi:hypothetical protein